MELVRELERRNQNLEYISLDTQEGANLAELYDVLQYPSVIAVDQSGVLQKSWSDGTLPLINELLYYMQSA
jgi:hypothetical protein